MTARTEARPGAAERKDSNLAADVDAFVRARLIGIPAELLAPSFLPQAPGNTTEMTTSFKGGLTRKAVIHQLGNAIVIDLTLRSGKAEVKATTSHQTPNRDGQFEWRDASRTISFTEPNKHISSLAKREALIKATDSFPISAFAAV